MKPRGSLAATVLTEGKTPLEGSADLEVLHQANRKGILPSGKEYFSAMKMYLKRICGFS